MIAEKIEKRHTFFENDVKNILREKSIYLELFEIEFPILILIFISPIKPWWI